MKCLMLFIALIINFAAYAQKMPPSLEVSKSEPIKYVGEEQTDPNFTHGSLRHAVGVHRYQALRSNRAPPRNWEQNRMDL